MTRAIAMLLVLVLPVAVVLAQANAPSPPAYRVIVNPRNPVHGVDRSFLADAFLKKVTRWRHGEAIRPVDLAESAPRRKFSEDMRGRPVAAVRSYWQQQIFSGRGIPPPELDGDQAVVKFVLQNEGAIGYVSGNAELGAAKVLAVR
jgi:ABC-type phosphate transport system substrate-binding protein